MSLLIQALIFKNFKCVLRTARYRHGKNYEQTAFNNKFFDEF